MTAPSVVPGRGTPPTAERLAFVAAWIDAIAADNAHLLETHRFQSALAASVREAAAEIERLRAYVHALDGAAITRDLAGIKGETDYIHRRDTDQRITYAIIDAATVLRVASRDAGGADR